MPYTFGYMIEGLAEESLMAGTLGAKKKRQAEGKKKPSSEKD